MQRAGVGLLMGVLLAAAGSDASAAAPPRPVDGRLVFERIAAEPDIVTPTGIAVDARGRILVIESHTHFRPEGYRGPRADRIRVFEDRDHDGRPEPAGIFFEGTKWTMGVAVAGDGSVFVATRSAIYRLADRDGDGRADGNESGQVPDPIVRLDSTGDYPHNGLSGFAFDGLGRVYFGLGENIGVPYRLIGRGGATFSGGGEGGSLYRCRPDGTGLERIATGFWNPFHMTFDPAGNLFAVDNDPDSRPPCRLLHIVEGGDYGYRFRNGRRGLHPFTSWNGELPGTLGMVAGTGEAPSGVVDYQANNLPADYRGALLVTSWGDHRIERYDLEPHGASFRSSMKPVVAGGDDFRPVGIAVAPDGALYISDWVDQSYDLHGKGRIWRLRRRPDAAPGRETQRAKPTADSPLARAEALRQTVDPAARATLLATLDSDDPFLRQAARRGLERSLAPADLATLAGSPDLSAARRLGLLLILRDQDRPEGRALLPRFLADPDPTIRFAAIQWVGEHHVDALRPRLLEGLSSPSITRELFQGALAALELLDRRKRDVHDELAGEDYIAALLRDPPTPPTILRRGLRMLRPDHPALTLSLLERLIGSGDEATRLEAVRSVARGHLDGRFKILARIASSTSEPESIRAAAIAGLADDAGRQRDALLGLAADGPPALRAEALRGLRGTSLSSAEVARLRRANQGNPALVDLVDRLGPHAASRSSAGHAQPPASVDDWLARLEGPADPAAGERVFYHAKGPGCYRCHQVDGRGGQAGPDLTNFAASTDRRRLIESIVAPSREIAPQFVPWNVARTDGTVFTGILLEQSPDGTLVFADTEGRRIAVKADDIAERKLQKTSIMPEDLVHTMTAQEMRDLIVFLSGRAPTGTIPSNAKDDHPQNHRAASVSER
jgi:putative membrane-bound dehydrogenase-like protein